MAPSKSTHKTASQPAPADPPQSQCTTIQLVQHAGRDLTYNKMHYRHTQINLRQQEIALAKAESAFQEQPWWDLSFAVLCGVMALCTVCFFGTIGVCAYNDLSGQGTSRVLHE